MSKRKDKILFWIETYQIQFGIAKELIEKLLILVPSEIRAFGYFGSPSITAITPYKEICFSAFSITKKNKNESKETVFNLDLPHGINI